MGVDMHHHHHSEKEARPWNALWKNWRQSSGRRSAASARIETTMAPAASKIRGVARCFACSHRWHARSRQRIATIYVITFVPFGNRFVLYVECRMPKVAAKLENKWSAPLTPTCCWLWMRSKKPRDGSFGDQTILSKHHH